MVTCHNNYVPLRQLKTSIMRNHGKVGGLLNMIGRTGTSMFLMSFLVVFVCCKSEKKGPDRSNILDCYIGKMRVAEYPTTNSYWLFISSILVNNTNDTIYLYPEKVNNNYPGSLCASYVQGMMMSDTIIFEKRFRGYTIAPKDTSRLLLIKRFYEPVISDSLFLKEFEDIKLACIHDSFKSNNPKMLQDIVFHRNEKTNCCIGDIDKWHDIKLRMKGEPMDY